jgi:large subunit ribosomal protein L21
MYAVIETGGKQYRVEVGTELEVELLDVEPGQALTLERVLLVGDGEDTAIGRPVVTNAAVEAEVVRRDRGEKLIVFKYRPKARRRVKKGHRQDHTILRITDVKLGGKSAAELVRKQEQDAKTERQRLEEAAARQAAEDAAVAAQLAKRSKSTTKADQSTAEAKPARGRAKPSTATTRGKAQASKGEATTPAAEAPKRGRAKASGSATAGQGKSTTSKSPAPKAGAPKAAAPKRTRRKKDE